MELRCLQSPAVSSILPRNGLKLKENPLNLRGHAVIKLPVVRRIRRDGRRLEFLDFRARANMGTIKAKSAAQDVASSNIDTKDKNLVFVAGATGKVGSRTVRELLKLGFKVRAGVRSIRRAESLVQSVRNIKLDDVVAGNQPIDKLELVECDLENPSQIGPALDNSSIVICCIGASEKEVLDITGPYRIDFEATKNLIDAATTAKVDHFILLTSLGTNKVGFPAAILNLFWGVLIWKRKAEEALLASGLPYSIVRPGGMERPTDSYKETHNMTLSEEDTLFGGQVSNLQVAELLAFMAKNRSLSYCKVVEVIAETTAPLTPMGDLLKKIPSQRKEAYPPQEPVDAGEPEPVVPDSIAEKEPEQIKVTASRPLSPYVAYEDLKPPTSPTPTQSTGSDLTEASMMEAVSTAASSSTSSSVEVNSSGTSTIVVDGISPQTAPKKQSPSSPYINYEDLKPPSSPTPTPSTGSSVTKAINAETLPAETSSNPTSIEVNSSEKPIISIGNGTPEMAPKKSHASSPYSNYDDLKPPSSPTPTPSGSTVKPSSVAPTSNPTESLASDQPLGDLKPPSLSSPNATTVPENNIPDTPVDEKTEATADHSGPKSRPLSPYTMYEDLKPPSSPVPSPRKC